MQWHERRAAFARHREPATDASAASKVSTSSLSDSIASHYDVKHDIVLQIETISDKMARRLTRTVHVSYILALALLIAGIVLLGSKSEDFFFHNNGLYIFNVALASCDIAALVAVGSVFTRKVVRATASGKHWSLRQQRAVGMAAAEQILQLTNSAMFLAVNAYFLGSNFNFSKPTVYWIQYVGISAANSMFFMIVMQAVVMLPAGSLRHNIEGDVFCTK